MAQISLTVPAAPKNDPKRGLKSRRHKPWTATSDGPAHFDWVSLDGSIQWHAFQRLIELLRDRHNDVLVVLGPFNEHMIAEENRAAYRTLRDGVDAWLSQQKIPHVTPDLLPSELYADASHPLTEGYRLLAQRISADAAFAAWLK